MNSVSWSVYKEFIMSVFAYMRIHGSTKDQRIVFGNVSDKGR